MTVISEKNPSIQYHSSEVISLVRPDLDHPSISPSAQVYSFSLSRVIICFSGEAISSGLRFDCISKLTRSVGVGNGVPAKLPVFDAAIFCAPGVVETTGFRRLEKGRQNSENRRQNGCAAEASETGGKRCLAAKMEASKPGSSNHLLIRLLSILLGCDPDLWKLQCCRAKHFPELRRNGKIGVCKKIQGPG